MDNRLSTPNQPRRSHQGNKRKGQGQANLSLRSAGSLFPPDVHAGSFTAMSNFILFLTARYRNTILCYNTWYKWKVELNTNLDFNFPKFL